MRDERTMHSICHIGLHQHERSIRTHREMYTSVHKDSAQTLAFYNVENAWENNAMHFVLVQQEITAAHRSKIKPTMMKYRPVCLCML